MLSMQEEVVGDTGEHSQEEDHRRVGEGRGRSYFKALLCVQWCMVVPQVIDGCTPGDCAVMAR